MAYSLYAIHTVSFQRDAGIVLKGGVFHLQVATLFSPSLLLIFPAGRFMFLLSPQSGTPFKWDNKCFGGGAAQNHRVNNSVVVGGVRTRLRPAELI